MFVATYCNGEVGSYGNCTLVEGMEPSLSRWQTIDDDNVGQSQQNSKPHHDVCVRFDTR